MIDFTILWFLLFLAVLFIALIQSAVIIKLKHNFYNIITMKNKEIKVWKEEAKNNLLLDTDFCDDVIKTKSEIEERKREENNESHV